MRNHLLRASPETFCVHVAGQNDPVNLAAVIHDVLAASNTPLTAAAAASPPAIDLDTARLDQIIGVKGQNNGGVYAFAVPRRDPISESGMELAPGGPMGVAQGTNFQPTGGGKAAITGDFVLTADEVNPVIKALLSDGIEVTADHSHMLDEQPRLFFLHFWGNDIGLASPSCLTKRLQEDDHPKRGKIRPLINENAIAFFVVNPEIAFWLRDHKLP